MRPRHLPPRQEIACRGPEVRHGGFAIRGGPVRHVDDGIHPSERSRQRYTVQEVDTQTSADGHYVMVSTLQGRNGQAPDVARCARYCNPHSFYMKSVSVYWMHLTPSHRQTVGTATSPPAVIRALPPRAAAPRRP